MLGGGPGVEQARQATWREQSGRAGERASEAVQAGCNSPWLGRQAGRQAGTSGKAVPGTGYGLLPPTVYRLPLPRTGTRCPMQRPALQHSNERPRWEKGRTPRPGTPTDTPTHPPPPRGRRERANAEATGSHVLTQCWPATDDKRPTTWGTSIPANMHGTTIFETTTTAALCLPSFLPAELASRRLGPPNAPNFHQSRDAPPLMLPAPGALLVAAGRVVERSPVEMGERPSSVFPHCGRDKFQSMTNCRPGWVG